MCKGAGKNTVESEEKSVKTDPELTQMLEFSEKDFKIVVITVFYVFKKLETRKI